jgi:tripartite-type tricarboxylate transporter receptor subunit TctC
MITRRTFGLALPLLATTSGFAQSQSWPTRPIRVVVPFPAGGAPSLPEVSTYEEAGIKGLVLDQWLGVFAPAGTPAEIITRLNGEIGKALADAEVRKNLQDSAQEAIGGTAEQFAGVVREDYAKLGRLVKHLNIKAE